MTFNSMSKTSIKIFSIIFSVFLVGIGLTVKAATPASFFYLTWESDGGVPINYAGKALVANAGVVKVLVQPLIYSSGSYLDSSQWDYKWYLNDEVLTQGKNLKIIRFRLSDYNISSYVVKVKVTPLNQVAQEKEITIPAIAPEVIIRPVAGASLFKNSIIQTNNSEIKLQAIPYFFGNHNGNLRLTWYLNDDRQKSDAVQDGILTVKKNTSTFSYNVSALMTVGGAALTRAVSEVKINFNSL